MAKLLFNGTSIFGHDGPTILGYRTLQSCVSKHDGREHYRVIGPPVPIQSWLTILLWLPSKLLKVDWIMRWPKTGRLFSAVSTLQDQLGLYLHDFFPWLLQIVICKLAGIVVSVSSNSKKKKYIVVSIFGVRVTELQSTAAKLVRLKWRMKQGFAFRYRL